ncbi:MAG: LuxR C-terminal-related transcriptional regulator [Planctomycetota bacterium]|jgi:DNA-binding NarL/FixJ family response regulator
MPTSVLLVGFCDVDWLGFRRMAEGTELHIVGNAPDEQATVSHLSQARFDLVVIDAHCPGDGPIRLVDAIKSLNKDQSILLFAKQEHPAILSEAASQGVLGLVLASDATSKVIERLRDAADRRSGWTREDLRRLSLSGGSVRAEKGYPVPLTQREREILTHVVEGGTNKQIAQGLGISYETVKEHIQHILQKVGVNDRSQAAVWAVHQGLV